MSAVGGDIIEVTYNHPTLGGGTLYCKANEDGTVDLGGYRSEDDDNSITGDGQMIDKLTYTRPSVELPPIKWDMTNEDELQKLVNMTESPVLATWTVNHINGKIWSGRGKPVGDLKGATNTSLVSLKLAFEKRLVSIS